MLTMPHIAENVIRTLDFETLLHWRTLSHVSKNFIDNNPRIWESRILEEVDKKYHQSWKETFRFLDANQLKKMAMLCHKNRQNCPENTHYNPILSAIEIDDTDLFKTLWQAQNPDEITCDYVMTIILWLLDESDNLDVFVILFQYVIDHYEEEKLIETYYLSMETSMMKNRIKICEYLTDFYGQNYLFSM